MIWLECLIAEQILDEEIERSFTSFLAALPANVSASDTKLTKGRSIHRVLV